MQKSLKLLDAQGLVDQVTLTELTCQEAELQRHQAENHKHDFCDEIDGFFSIVLDAKLSSSDSLLEVELLDLLQYLLILVHPTHSCHLMTSCSLTSIFKTRITIRRSHKQVGQ